jgi:hypothetical protein
MKTVGFSRKTIIVILLVMIVANLPYEVIVRRNLNFQGFPPAAAISNIR